MTGKMQQLTAKEIAQSTVLFSITKINDLYQFNYYGKCDGKVGMLFKHSVSINEYNRILKEKGLEEIINYLENLRLNPLETIYNIINENKDKNDE